MTQSWEYTYVTGAERDIDRLVGSMNEAGEQGWEAFAAIGIKKGISSDAVTIMLKRPRS